LTERAFARVLFWSFVALVCWGVLRPRRSRPFFGTFDGSGDLAIPGVTPSSVLLSLALFNALFAVQNAMDMAWLWGLLPLPEGLTLAEYAHRGAYPLIVTALLSALFVLVTLRPGSATAGNPMIRRLVLIWLAQNVVLVASSMLRLFDYVDAYSLTRLRIAAFAWMALVMIGLALIAWRLVRGRSARWLINANCLAAAVLLTGYAFVDTGAIAARWNVDHAQEIDGSGAKLDVCYLAELGESALSALVAAERKPLPPIVAERVATARALAQHALAQRLKRGDWTLLGARRLAAAEAVGASTPKAWPASRTDCGGAPYGFD
jgi:hypothetical protein